jgi:hypothetical protein
LGSPQAFQHRLHVDGAYQWDGDPMLAIDLKEKVGEGCVFLDQAYRYM